MIRTFYWQPKTRKFPLRARGSFRYGNAGDSYNRDLIGHYYENQRVLNSLDSGERLLLVGSISHRALDGDMLCGVGLKSAKIPTEVSRNICVRGLRGPLSFDAFEKAGYNLDEFSFLGDPGLLIKQVFPSLLGIHPRVGQVGFVPHYREKSNYKSTKYLKVIDIDAPAKIVCEQIAQCESVISSSLHGIIWSHALGRPVHSVFGDSGEESFKYEDYFASIDQVFRPFSSLDKALKTKSNAIVPNVDGVVNRIVLPSLEELVRKSIVV